VEKGQVLAKIVCKDYLLSVEQAKAALKAALAQSAFDRSQLEKARKLSKQKSISGDELDRRIANASRSEADSELQKAILKSSAHSVDKCSLRAPFDAVVVEKIANVGDYLVPGSPVVRLLDNEEIEISARVQEQDLESLKRAKNLVFTNRSGEFPVILRTVLPLMNSRLRSYEVRLTFAHQTASPGAAGRLQWRLDIGQLPSEYVIRRGDELGIFVAEEGQAIFRRLPDAQEGKPVQVELPMWTVVIVDGRFVVSDKQPVNVVQP
jgi:RND family efflux transporter MFP subunit